MRVQPAWRDITPIELVFAAVDVGISNVIVLDVAQVGRGQGGSTLELCRQLSQQFPQVDFYSGGGIRNDDDVQQFGDAGCAGVLVATALHRGQLSL